MRRLKQLEEENAKLKPLVADLSLDRAMLLQDVLAKALKPSHLRELASDLMHLAGVGITDWRRKGRPDLTIRPAVSKPMSKGSLSVVRRRPAGSCSYVLPLLNDLTRHDDLWPSTHCYS